MKKRVAIASFFVSTMICTTAFATPEMASDMGIKGPDELPPITGKVVESVNSSGYTYLLLEKGGKKQWVAIPELYIKVGDEVELQGGVDMGEFTSKPLGRKFEQIIFSNGPTENFNKQRKESAHKGVDMSVPAPGKKNGAKAVEGLKVDKAPGENSYSIAEILQQRVSLKDRKIVVRGQVIKASTGIMGKNWIHIADGSGKAGSKLVVTTSDSPNVGDIVTATGTFHVDVDFGGGYFYESIIEDAVVK